MTEDSLVRLLREVYLAVLARCEPGVLLRDAVRGDRIRIPGNLGSIVAVGKCAVPLAKAAAELTGIDTGLVIHPEGYAGDGALPRGLERLVGTHPIPSGTSRIAALRALEFVAAQREPVLFLVSGGASACMEEGLQPHVSLEQLTRLNRRLVASGRPIEEINTVRRHLSAVKGGRLGALAPRGSVSLVYSDVPPGRPELVGSGPTANDPTTLADAAEILRDLGDEESKRLSDLLVSGAVPETTSETPTRVEVIADSDELVRAAELECRARGLEVTYGPGLDADVEQVARALTGAAASLGAGQVLIAAGEPTVVVRGEGSGGRCSELGARFALAADEAGLPQVAALFGSSDGKDGSSPAGAVIVRASSGRRLDPRRAAEALKRSASYELVADFGEPIIMMPTGNNLRDIALLVRGW